MKKRLKQTAGFTLVELIVVIAILGVLAGVAVPTYSGYVRKANMAADQTLVDSINTAFAAACIENQVDISDLEFVPALEIGEDGVLDVEESALGGMNEDFGSYLGGEVKFKVATSDEVLFDRTTHMFKIFEGVKTYTFAGQTITLSAKDVAILSGDNAFSNRGSAALLNDVGVLENLLDTGIGETVLTEVKQSDEFLWALGSYAGLVQGEDESDDDYLDRVAGYSVDPNNADAIYSAQIMYAASNAANVTDAQLNELFTGTVTSNITVKNQDGSTNTAATMANAALAYGMYTAYKEQYPDAEDVDNFTLTVGSSAFAEYYKSSQGQADLEAYRAAMNMISDNTSNSEVTNSILNNGIVGNTDLENLMKEIMGN